MVLKYDKQATEQFKDTFEIATPQETANAFGKQVLHENELFTPIIEQLPNNIYKITTDEFCMTIYVENTDNDYYRLSICKEYNGDKNKFNANSKLVCKMLEEKGFLKPLKTTILN